MKFFRHGEPGRERPGVLDAAGTPRDLTPLCADLAGEALAPTRLAQVTPAVAAGLPVLEGIRRYGPCVAGTGNFIAVGLNYTDHAAETGSKVPREPILFNKAPSCIVGPNDDLELPPGSAKTDWEVELAVVIGARAYRVEERDVNRVIAGYCLCHDVSERAYQTEGTGQWMKGKGCPTFGPLGPYLVTPDVVGDVDALAMWLDVNGTRMQTGSTANMVFGARYLVAYVSQFMRLEPGDVITTGTPAGVGMGMKPPRYLAVGDEVRLGIEGLGEQRQTVVPARAY